jgi:hypothetical protein
MTHNPLQDDWTQRLKENPPDPLEYIRQVHEEWLTELEGLAVEAITSNNWDAFYAHVVGFQNEHDLHGESLIAIGKDFPCLTVRHRILGSGEFGASTASLESSGADSSPRPSNNERLGDKTNHDRTN